VLVSVPCFLVSVSQEFLDLSLGHHTVVLCESVPEPLLYSHADRHAGDISFALCLFVTLFVCKYFCNGYLRCRLTQGDEIWQDGRPGWVAVHAPFW